MRAVIFVLLSLMLIMDLLRRKNTEAPNLDNGGDTLWDTQTEEVADEMCADCETDAEKARALESVSTLNKYFYITKIY